VGREAVKLWAGFLRARHTLIDVLTRGLGILDRRRSKDESPLKDRCPGHVAAGSAKLAESPTTGACRGTRQHSAMRLG
jgi:hypothetical protein